MKNILVNGYGNFGKIKLMRSNRAEQWHRFQVGENFYGRGVTFYVGLCNTQFFLQLVTYAIALMVTQKVCLPKFHHDPICWAKKIPNCYCFLTER